MGSLGEFQCEAGPRQLDHWGAPIEGEIGGEAKAGTSSCGVKGKQLGRSPE